MGLIAAALETMSLFRQNQNVIVHMIRCVPVTGQSQSRQLTRNANQVLKAGMLTWSMPDLARRLAPPLPGYMAPGHQA